MKRRRKRRRCVWAICKVPAGEKKKTLNGLPGLVQSLVGCCCCCCCLVYIVITGLLLCSRRRGCFHLRLPLTPYAEGIKSNRKSCPIDVRNETVFKWSPRGSEMNMHITERQQLNHVHNPHCPPPSFRFSSWQPRNFRNNTCCNKGASHLQFRLSRRDVAQKDGPLYLEFPIEFVTVAIQHSQVQWTKVWIKISVHELVIYAEIVGVWRGLWSDGHLQSSEIELICKEEKKCWWCWNSIHRQRDHF